MSQLPPTIWLTIKLRVRFGSAAEMIIFVNESTGYIYIYMCNSIGFGNLSNFANWLGFRGSLTK